MLKVVLIDDEPTIREGLKSIIDWEAYGFAVCGEASNGNEGLEKICTLGADLAIVDVKMPVMDGLQMVSELNTRRIECEYIILSAYSDFKYAQSAIELGIGSYVLKPIEESELIEKLLKVRESIQNRKKAKDYLDLSVNLSRIKLLQQMVQGQPMPWILRWIGIYMANLPLEAIPDRIDRGRQKRKV
jgi:two-component system response regulator YesN